MGTAPPAQEGDTSQHHWRDRTSRGDSGAQALGSGLAGGKSQERSRRRRCRGRTEADGWGWRAETSLSDSENPSCTHSHRLRDSPGLVQSQHCRVTPTTPNHPE